MQLGNDASKLNANKDLIQVSTGKKVHNSQLK